MDRLIDRVDTYNIRLYAHSEMRTHFHALLETPQANLGRFMHSLNTAYTAFYNTRHRRHGHLFQGRYGAKPVEGDSYLLSLSCYIHLGPVHIKRIKGRGLAIGDESFVGDIRSRTIELIGRYKRQEDVSLRHIRAHVAPERVLAEAGEVMGVEPNGFKVRRRNSALRAIAARMLCKYAGLTQRDAAEVLGMNSGAAASSQLQKLSALMAGDRKLSRQVIEIESRLDPLSRA